jgi:hypothetical protein
MKKLAFQFMAALLTPAAFASPYVDITHKSLKSFEFGFIPCSYTQLSKGKVIAGTAMDTISATTQDGRVFAIKFLDGGWGGGATGNSKADACQKAKADVWKDANLRTWFDLFDDIAQDRVSVGEQGTCVKNELRLYTFAGDTVASTDVKAIQRPVACPK